MTRVLMIMTGGLIKDGISITQLEYMKHMPKEDLMFDILAVHNNDTSMIEAFKENGCNVITTPSRVNHIFQYTLFVYKLMRSKRYEAIHIHGSSAMMGIELFIAKCLRVPVRIAHSRNTYTKHPRMDALFRILFDRSYNIALACGQDAGYFLFRRKDYTVFYNAKDFKRFAYNGESRTITRTKYNLNGKVVLGFVGTLNEQKNPLFLVDLFADVLHNNSNYILMIIGDGTLREKVLKYAEAKKCISNILFIGRSNEVEILIQGCDLMLLPSLYEGLPNVVLEWQIAGIPALVSDKVTKECRQTQLVSFLPIDKGTDIWSNAICQYDENINASEQSKNACERMAKAGFEINKSCDRIRCLYLRGELPNE